MSTEKEIDLNTIKPESYYSLKSLAETINYTAATLAKYIRTGELKAKKQGRKYYVLGKNFKQWWDQE